MEQDAEKRRAEEPTSAVTTLTEAAAPVPDVYLRFAEKFENKWFWYKLDFEHEKPVLMDWQLDRHHDDSVAVALKSEIFVLGGGRFITINDQNKYIKFPNVYHINTAASSTTSPSRFESAPPMLKRQSNEDMCVVFKEKIFFFDSSWDFYDGQYIMEIYNPNSNKWLGFFPEDFALPREVFDQNAIMGTPFVLDRQNNRILIHFYPIGLYAFYPDSFKWELLCFKELPLMHFESSVVMNNVLYYCFKPDGNKPVYVVGTMDIADELKPLEIVWPNEFDDQIFYKSSWMAPVDLGNDKLCLVAQSHECTHNLSDDLYEYTGDEDKDIYVLKAKYMLVVTFLVLEVEKKPPPPPQLNSGCQRGRSTIHVKSESRFSFKFEDLHFPYYSKIKVENALVVSR